MRRLCRTPKILGSNLEKEKKKTMAKGRNFVCSPVNPFFLYSLSFRKKRRTGSSMKTAQAGGATPAWTIPITAHPRMKGGNDYGVN